MSEQQPEATLWATSTDLADTAHERKRYFILIRDGERQINFSLAWTALDNKIVAEPYSTPDYNYTIHDHCDHEADECVLDDPDFEENEYGPQPDTVFVEVRKGSEEGIMIDWKAIEEQAKRDLEQIQTDQDAVAYIVKYFVRDLQANYLKIYRSDRYEMGRTPRQAIDTLLRLPPL